MKLNSGKIETKGRRMIVRGFFSVALLLTTFSTLPVAQTGSDAAKSSFSQGFQALQKSDYSEARRCFEEGLRL